MFLEEDMNATTMPTSDNDADMNNDATAPATPVDGEEKEAEETIEA